MLIEVEQVIPVKKVVGKVCNKCGRHFAGKMMSNAHSLEVVFPWGSMFENTKWGFELCDDCSCELVKSFALVPQGFGGRYHGGTLVYENIEEWEHQAMFDTWKKTGKFELLG